MIVKKFFLHLYFTSNVVTQVEYKKTFNNYFIANCLQNVPVKEFLKSC